MKLPVEFKKKWIAALRSGEYKQGVNALESNGKFCCLGVACKVAGVATKKYDAEIDEELELEWIPENTIIPTILIGGSKQAEILSAMNDGGGPNPGKSFLEIADYIEANL